jgi:hypothetical protein
LETGVAKLQRQRFLDPPHERDWVILVFVYSGKIFEPLPLFPNRLVPGMRREKGTAT